MTEAEAKSYLLQLREINELINDKQEKADTIYSQMLKVTPTLQLVPVSGGGNSDSICDGVAKLEILRAEINAEIDRYCDLQREISNLITSVKDGRYRELLRKRYELFKTWEQIACEMDCSYQWVCKLHGRALQVVARMLSSEKTSNS